MVDLKLAILEHPKTSYKLFKAIRQAEKRFCAGFNKRFNSLLHSETKKVKTF